MSFRYPGLMELEWVLSALIIWAIGLIALHILDHKLHGFYRYKLHNKLNKIVNVGICVLMMLMLVFISIALYILYKLP